MTNFFDKLYTAIPIKQNWLDKLRFYSALRFLTRTTANFVLPIYFRLTSHHSAYKLGSTLKTEERLIVSLTSFPARIGKVWMVIETLLRQTQKPDMIIIWLSKEQFPTLDALPKNLLRIQQRGLTIALRDGDIRSHKKYYYTLQEYPNDVLITVDDDILYRTDMLQKLVSTAKKYPNCVVANYAHEMKWNEKGLCPYMQWLGNYKLEACGFRYFFGSGGGTLFPVNSLFLAVVTKDVFTKVCPQADDVWLNAMCRMQHTQVATTNYHTLMLPIQNRNNVMLASTNISSGNDIQIEAVRNYCIETYEKDPFEKL